MVSRDCFPRSTQSPRNRQLLSGGKPPYSNSLSKSQYCPWMSPAKHGHINVTTTKQCSVISEMRKTRTESQNEIKNQVYCKTQCCTICQFVTIFYQFVILFLDNQSVFHTLRHSHCPYWHSVFCHGSLFCLLISLMRGEWRGVRSRDNSPLQPAATKQQHNRTTQQPKSDIKTNSELTLAHSLA